MKFKQWVTGLGEFLVWFAMFMTMFLVYMVSTADIQVFRYMAF